MPRENDGEGNIHQCKDGRRTARIRTTGRRFLVYGETRGAAATRRRKRQSQHVVGQLTTPRRLTVKDFLDQWLESVRPSRKASTVHGYEDIVSLHLIPVLGGIKLQKLAPQHIISLCRDKQNAGLSPRRVAMIHAVLRNSALLLLTTLNVPSLSAAMGYLGSQPAAVLTLFASLFEQLARHPQQPRC